MAVNVVHQFGTLVSPEAGDSLVVGNKTTSRKNMQLCPLC